MKIVGFIGGTSTRGGLIVCRSAACVDEITYVDRFVRANERAAQNKCAICWEPLVSGQTALLNGVAS